MQQTKMQYQLLKKLIPYQNNPRQHSPDQIQKVVKSIKEFGFTNPILIDDKDVIIAGHARFEAATILGLESVPTIKLSHLTPEQVKAYVIADNQLALGSTWDEALLAQEIEFLSEANFDVGLLGFDAKEMQAIQDTIDQQAIPEGKIDEDEVPVVNEIEVTVKSGDIYGLGKYYECGDCGHSEREVSNK